MGDREFWIKNVKGQLSDAGMDPDDPDFWSAARNAPRDLDFYDQVTWAMNHARSPREIGEQNQEIESFDDVLKAVRDERVI